MGIVGWGVRGAGAGRPGLSGDDERGVGVQWE